ncbi:MAG: RNA polymerase sigma factor [Prolixibacteraceae bacterium]|jgi:RNA polymerase sigma-70 factor (ECF subfamily)|nr:RNA polymerase sigma factor [Prolixibacteraceae bacterium]
MTGTDDASIVAMLKDPAQKDKGFILLMNLYKEPIYWHIRRLVVSHEDAEDILQETFIKVYRHSGSFRGDSKIFTWLYRISTNECSYHLKKRKNVIKRTGQINGEVSGELSGNDMENSKEILVKFQLAIQELPRKQKIVFNLRYYDELSYEEISKVMGSSISSLKTNYHLASEKIKKYLIDHV